MTRRDSDVSERGLNRLDTTLVHTGHSELGPDAPVARNTIEIVARIPNRPSRVVITIDISGVDGSAKVSDTSEYGASDTAPEPELRLAQGRPLEPLLFATDLAKLMKRIGQGAADAVSRAITAAGQQLLDLAGEANPLAKVHAAATGKAGIVLLGGYDVVPSYRFDVLPAELRSQLGSGVDDTDDFIVWSDQPYTVIGGNGMASLPISRIPDGGSATLMRAALSAPGPVGEAARFGIRNMARPFAQSVFDAIDGSESLKACEPVHSAHYEAREAHSSAVYIMLHGSDTDSTAFWGETQDGGMIEGLSLANVPESSGSVVFSGCCWGALTVAERANAAGNRVTPRDTSTSIALAFLAAGARAFVGCTGTHYSPSGTEPDYFGGPMHTAFWAQIKAGLGPAKALYNAKVAYIEGMPHGRTLPGELAIEYKILRQFTCLGLGW